MDRQYFVLLDGEDPMIITVKDDVNRPNNPDCDAVLEEWVHANYGHRIFFDYWELGTCGSQQI